MGQQKWDYEAISSTAEQGSQQSRFLPGGRIDAENIAASSVVSGVQYNTYYYQQGQKYAPPLHRPRRAEHFQDRESELAWLLAHLHPGRIVTVCGSGGMGKTALVAEVLWTLAPADTPPASFPHGIIFHSFYRQPQAAVALEQLARSFGEDPLPTPAQAAQRALSGKHVLLVLDGVDEAEYLEQVLAVCASCAVLVTSRRRSDAADPALLFDLQRLPSDDAVAVVQAWQAAPEKNAAIITRICQLVGGLPLALRLAGNYLALHQNEAAEYLSWLEEDLWEALDQGHSVHKSIPVLLERSLARLSSDAQTVLAVIGLLALAPFERDLVAEVLNLAARATSSALEELVDYGLLVHLGLTYEVSHPLIHRYALQVLLARQDKTQRRVLVERLILVLANHFPEVEHTNWTVCERLMPHIQVCATHIEQQNKASAEDASLFSKAGQYLKERGRYEQAEPLFQRALAIREQVLGLDHPDTSTSLDEQATLYWLTEKYEQAEPLFQRALAIKEKTLGPDHFRTAITLNNLAHIYQDQGKYEQAEESYQRALTIYEKAWGPEHPHVAYILNYLVKLYRDQNKYAQAEVHYQRARHYFERSLARNKELQDEEGIVASLRAIVDVTIAEEDYTATDQYLEQSVELLIQTGDQRQASVDLFNAGVEIYDQLGKQNAGPEMQERYQQVHRYLDRSLALGEGLISESETITILNRLVDVTIAEGDYSATNQYLKRQVELLIQTGDQRRASVVLVYAGQEIEEQLHKQSAGPETRERYQQARCYYERSLALGEGLIDEAEVITILELLVRVTIAEDDKAATDKYAEKVVERFIQQGDQKRASDFLLSVGQALYEQSKQNESSDENEEEESEDEK